MPLYALYRAIGTSYGSNLTQINKMKNIIIFYSIVIVLFLGTSCTSYKALLSYNEFPEISQKSQTIQNFKPLTIHVNDLLSIQISSTDADAIRPFTISAGTEEGGTNNTNSYLVNSNGEIEFPTIGKIKLQGLEIEAAKNKIQAALAPYFQQAPIINLRLTNFRVIVNGEVGSPGAYGVPNDRLTIIEAITMAGDFTSYSRRDSILIIREQDGVRNFGYVNFNNADLFNSPYFYLAQNDVIYVRPSKTKVNSVQDPASRFLPWISAGVSVVVLLITLFRRR